jgi:hypothetical protein
VTARPSRARLFDGTSRNDSNPRERRGHGCAAVGLQQLARPALYQRVIGQPLRGCGFTCWGRGLSPGADTQKGFLGSWNVIERDQGLRFRPRRLARFALSLLGRG